MRLATLAVSALSVAALSASAAAARDAIRVVGSSTVFPYTQAVAEQFVNNTGAPSPIVESTGTGGGMKIFCAGIGEAHPDVTGASRAMKRSEWDLCISNGVDDISEALIGYDGLSIAISRQNDFDWDLTLGQVYLALAAQVPVNGEWVDNPYRKWSEIDPSLPDVEILAFGPPPTSGTRDAFVELAMHAGCEELDYVKNGGFDSKWVKENCSRMRTDGPFVEAGENDNLIVQRLEADPHAIGIFGYSFLYENLDRLKPVNIEGVEPSLETIADKSYPISRPLYIYVKNPHRGVIPYLEEFIEEYMSEEALGPDGYLAERGLVTLPDDLRAEVQDRVLNAEPMEPPAE
ncbi:phosphate transport system substrate-binding protein [Meinhardsimonia xiamenensis]|jgi:phosphate transport system substrate-binding protein|uniref:Phosphate transport system substrate-binding protein n=1 Tax=Meinhardsimonia xiamenensis TaxID=990712 RepID=A0A1G9H469_9RHOB|nr:substrate-binding domain-containing protein [Meinhardsimonia xiamenensis]PRX29783.1 phosphate transport system substrate-binding protein [Meinhardsimonia xiamenensis]SDL07756.1 phosphate transport system substrate-binding protein [Meinhardsimonia xiamenensis]